MNKEFLPTPEYQLGRGGCEVGAPCQFHAAKVSGGYGNQRGEGIGESAGVGVETASRFTLEIPFGAAKTIDARCVGRVAGAGQERGVVSCRQLDVES